MIELPSKESLSKLFFEDELGCWVWTGPMREKNKGCILINKKQYAAHRIIRMVFGPSFPEENLLLSTCGNKRCVNPAHNLTGDERFLQQYDVDENGCHIFNGPCNRGGYGTTGNGGKRAFAHRRMYELKVGPIPPDKFLLHSCHNRKCVNPDHLRPGTHQENMQDMVSAGRSTKGHKSPNYTYSKLSEKDILDIRQLAAENEFPLHEIADAYNIDTTYVSEISKGTCWPHVAGPRTDKKHTRASLSQFPKGENHHQAKITEQQVIGIRNLIAEGVLTQGEIGAMFGIDQTQVSDIAGGEIWKSSPGPIKTDKYAPKNRKISRGEDHGCSTLTESDVQEIRRLGSTGELNQPQIAEKFGIDQTTVSNILVGKIWNHLPSSCEYKKRTTGTNSKGKACKLTEESVTQMREYYRNGWSFSAIAETFKISPESARGAIIGKRWSHVPGAIPDARRNITENDAIKIKSMLRNGMKPKSVSEELGVNLRVVYKISSGQSWSHVS